MSMLDPYFFYELVLIN